VAGYLIRRILWLIPVLFFVALITFLLMHLVPGGPFDQDVSRTPSTVINLNRKYGLDKPVWQQFITYLTNVLHGDLGISLQFQTRSVSSIISGGLKVSGILGLLAFVYAVTIGVALGIIAALRRNSLVDYFSLLFATLGASMPTFVLAIILVTILSVHWHIFPVLGWGDWKQAILPMVTLGSAPAAYIARITRASMLEVMQQDYVRTAWAKGLRERSVVVRHIVKNALIPVLTLLGPLSAGLVTGSFIIEQFFAIPGIGRSFVGAVFARDYGMIMGISLFYAFLVAFANLIVDILYGVVDPRIRLS
jgi:ABC-type dipeptide/oligopeptide/nickel transport system permease component